MLDSVITEDSTVPASGSRTVYNLDLFSSSDPRLWEKAYVENMNPKYKKNTRNFSKSITGATVSSPNIYVIPRVRGGPSYKDVDLIEDDPTKLQYCPISKGYSMQNVSSFTLGPVIGEGLCIVNAAFSKIITIAHIEGGGKVNLKRKNFWQRSRKPTRTIKIIDRQFMMVDGQIYMINEWLERHLHLWFNEWELHRKHIALSSEGSFHWSDPAEVVAYWHNHKPIDFVTWKIECYVKPAYALIRQTDVYHFLVNLYNVHKISIGLVHPMAKDGALEPITASYIQQLYESKDTMSCMPYVVAGLLLGVAV